MCLASWNEVKWRTCGHKNSTGPGKKQLRFMPGIHYASFSIQRGPFVCTGELVYSLHVVPLWNHYQHFGREHYPWAVHWGANDTTIKLWHSLLLIEAVLCGQCKFWSSSKTARFSYIISWVSSFGKCFLSFSDIMYLYWVYLFLVSLYNLAHTFS